MKKKVIGFLAIAALAVTLAACGNGSKDKDKATSGSDKAETSKLIVGASPTPHAEILEHVKPILKKEGIDLETATFDDIEENPKNLVFKHDIDPALLATAYQNDEADLVAINANFAVGIDLNPVKDNVLIEADNSPYVNIIAVRADDKDNKNIKKLVEVLHSQEVQDWILEEYQGFVKPVSK